MQRRQHDADASALIASFPTQRLGAQYEIGQTLTLSWSPADAVAIAG
jgi:putative spermidine/putrescine transport system ATP-binding protein